MSGDVSVAELYSREGPGGCWLAILDGGGPSKQRWLGAVASIPAYALLGAGHWRRHRRRRAITAWTQWAAQVVDACARELEPPPRLPPPAATSARQQLRRQRAQRIAVPALVAVSLCWVRWWGLSHPRTLSAPVIASRATGIGLLGAQVARAVYTSRWRVAGAGTCTLAARTAQLWAIREEPVVRCEG